MKNKFFLENNTAAYGFNFNTFLDNCTLLASHYERLGLHNIALRGTSEE
tara:strand:- start:26496 stop:26642 length:147 start_codon:yes stop_codon:yes gene_type:complete